MMCFDYCETCGAQLEDCTCHMPLDPSLRRCEPRTGAGLAPTPPDRAAWLLWPHSSAMLSERTQAADVAELEVYVQAEHGDLRAVERLRIGDALIAAGVPPGVRPTALVPFEIGPFPSNVSAVYEAPDHLLLSITWPKDLPITLRDSAEALHLCGLMPVLPEVPALDASGGWWCPVYGLGGCPHEGQCVGALCVAVPS